MKICFKFNIFFKCQLHSAFILQLNHFGKLFRKVFTGWQRLITKREVMMRPKPSIKEPHVPPQLMQWLHKILHRHQRCSAPNNGLPEVVTQKQVAKGKKAAWYFTKHESNLFF